MRNSVNTFALCKLLLLTIAIPFGSVGAQDDTPEGLLSLLRERDANFLRQFTITGMYESPAHFRHGDQGTVIRTAKLTGNEAERGIALTEPVYSSTPRYLPPGTGRYSPQDYNEQWELVLWKKHAYYALQTPNLNISEEGHLGHWVRSDGTYTTKPPNRRHSPFRPDDESSLYEFKRILLATGRGYSRYLRTIVEMERTSEGFIRVKAVGSYISTGEGVCELMIDPRADYLVRSAKFSTTKPDQPLRPWLQCTTSGQLRRSDGFIIAQRGVVSVILSEESTLLYSTDFNSITDRVDQELLNSLRARFSSHP